MNGNVFIGGRTTFNIGDISINSRVFVSSDVSFGGNLYAAGRSVLGGDISANTRLFVGSDASFGGNLYAYGQTIINGDISANARLFVGSDKPY
jgi:cytoskeletal protein CcmA (bactofilin family)